MLHYWVTAALVVLVLCTVLVAVAVVLAQTPLVTLVLAVLALTVSAWSSRGKQVACLDYLLLLNCLLPR
jgi:hypothetical protein